jgi:hypothetical protein
MHAILDACPLVHLSMIRELLCYLTNLFIFIVKDIARTEASRVVATKQWRQGKVADADELKWTLCERDTGSHWGGCGQTGAEAMRARQGAMSRLSCRAIRTSLGRSSRGEVKSRGNT